MKCTKCKENKKDSEFPKKSYGKADSWCKSCHYDKTREFKRTKEGIVGEIYNSQKFSSKQRGHRPPSYTKEQLREWLFCQTLFHKLYNEWKLSNYDTWKKPSVDRFDDSKGYSLDGIQLMTWKQNKQKSSNDIRNGISTSGKRCKKVFKYDMDMNFIDSYVSASEAQRQNIGSSQGHISAVCRKERNAHLGFIWCYE